MPPKAKKLVAVAASKQEGGLQLPNVPLDAILSFLKDTRGVVSWKAGDLRACLKLDGKGTEPILQILEMQGYVHREEKGDEWLTTGAGESVAHSKEPKLSLQKVKEALADLKERIAETNRDKRSEFRVVRATAFGDFLSGRAKVQAADVGVEIELRGSAHDDDSSADHKKQEIMNALRGKSRFLSLQPYREWMSRRSHRDLL